MFDPLYPLNDLIGIGVTGYVKWKDPTDFAFVIGQIFPPYIARDTAAANEE